VAPPPTRRWLHVALSLATLATTTYIGFEHFASFLSDFGTRRIVVRSMGAVVVGLYYSVTILAILGAHEMGHYLACRYYRINASWPYFIPAPITMIGTFGAFIKIRQPILNKRQLFDVGIAGPLAGFAVALPALVIGLAMSRVTRLPPTFQGLELGEPLLFRAITALIWGPIPDGYSLNLHPVALAAWFGLLATLLNLFPMGQLDGGHIAYAVLGRRSRHVTLAMVVIAVGLTFVSLSWVVWTILMVVMLWIFGLNHPPTLDEDVPLDAGRRRLALVATGTLQPGGRAPEKSFRNLDVEALVEAFRVNAAGPALVARHVLPLLPRDGRSVFAALSARVGSIGDNRLGGWHAYRASKAALNMIVRTLAVELARTRPEAICVALHPGTVDTDLSRPFQKGVPEGRLLTPAQSAERLTAVLDGLTPGDSGGFFAWDGKPIPW
jgi:hypothetical protein